MRVIVVNSPAQVPLAIQQVVDETVRDITRIQYDSILKKQIPYLEKLHAGYFRAGADPDGRPWAALAPSTIQRKGHGTILVDSRRLVASLMSRSGLDSVRDIRKNTLTYGTRVPYSIYHQQDEAFSSPSVAAAAGAVLRHRRRGLLGAGRMVNALMRRSMQGVMVIARKLRQRVNVPGARAGGGGHHLPARPHVGLSEKSTDELVGKVADGMEEQLKRTWR